MQRHLVLSGATIARIVAIAGASLGVKSGVFPSEDCHRRRCQWVGRDTCGTQPRFNAGIMAQWKQDTILKLIGAYRERRFLWDKTAVEYTDRSKRYNAWKEIANEVRCDQVWSRYYLMLLNNVCKLISFFFLAIFCLILVMYTNRKERLELIKN